MSSSLPYSIQYCILFERLALVFVVAKMHTSMAGIHKMQGPSLHADVAAPVHLLSGRVLALKTGKRAGAG